jgi:(p)ppGpp synthase/HD superfamily hydrolase
MELTRKAIALAMKAHEGQTRKVSGLPYVVHPIEVYSIVKKFKESHNIDSICAAAVLHDTLEDTAVTYDELEKEFGYMTASLVAEVTSDATKVQLLGKLQYINEKLYGLTSYALVIKLADMLANVTDNPVPKTVKRISQHMDFLEASGRVISNTHKKLIEQIRYSIATLY